MKKKQNLKLSTKRQVRNDKHNNAHALSVIFKEGRENLLFNKIFVAIGKQGKLVERDDEDYAIIIPLNDNYVIKIKRVFDESITVSLCYTFKFGYKNWNIATIEDADYIDVASINEIIDCIDFEKKLARKFINEHKDNVRDMLIHQEHNLRK